jgi:two-component system phosphate regulon sensor histidine kinase PhoR
VKADVIGPNAPKGAVLTIHDISELRRLERIRREFVANVSHELKTPLTVIQACADTLAEGALDDPVAAQKFLGRIDEQSSRLAELINDMLDLGRIEASNEVLELEPVDPEQIIRECASQREGIAAANQISLTIELSTEQFFVDTDATSLRTLVGNLTDNAIKYTPAGGSVTLELDRTADEAIIRVRDTGIGIEREHINRIFQRFYRVDSARSRASGGSGLGLAICKHLAQQLNGEIDVESVPGTGSTFTLRLPLAGAES